MSKRNPSRAPKSINVVIFCGVLAAFVGATLGILSLVTQPVTETRLAPENPLPGAVYYIKGSDGGSSRWRTSRAQIFKGSPATLKISDGDLNGWANSMFTPSQLRPRATAEGEDAVAGLRFLGLKVSVSGVNFRIVGDELQMGGYIEFPDLSPGKRIVYQALGSFAPSSEGPRFVARKSTLGRASIAGLPGVGKWLHGSLVSKFSKAPEWTALAEVWANVESIEIAQDVITLTVQ